MNIRSISIALLAGTICASTSLAHAVFNVPSPDKLVPVYSGHVLSVSDTKDDMAMTVYKVGALEIHNPFARATPPNAPVSGGYLTIKNTGDMADRLVGGMVDFAAKVEVHEMKMDGEIMKMREVSGGLEIPAGAEVVLKPGGLHIMFMKLSERLQAGEMRKVTLEFEKAGKIEMEFPVKEIGSAMKKMDHSKHGESD